MYYRSVTSGYKDCISKQFFLAKATAKSFLKKMVLYFRKHKEKQFAFLAKYSENTYEGVHLQ